MFKSVFEIHSLAKYLLKYVFNTEEEIVDVLTEKESLKTFDSKKIYFDLFIVTKSNLYIAEMQNGLFKDLERRAFYYYISAASELLKQGEKYSELKNVKVAFICNFNVFNKFVFRNKYKICSKVDYDCFDFLNIEYINLLEIDNCKTVEEYNFFNCFNGVYANTTEINEIKSQVLRFNNNEEWMKMYREKLSLYGTAFNEGESRGIKVGKKQGIQEEKLNTINLIATINKDAGATFEKTFDYLLEIYKDDIKLITDVLNDIYK